MICTFAPHCRALPVPVGPAEILHRYLSIIKWLTTLVPKLQLFFDNYRVDHRISSTTLPHPRSITIAFRVFPRTFGIWDEPQGIWKRLRLSFGAVCSQEMSVIVIYHNLHLLFIRDGMVVEASDIYKYGSCQPSGLNGSS